jgi:hypothetical protein
MNDIIDNTVRLFHEFQLRKAREAILEGFIAMLKENDTGVVTFKRTMPQLYQGPTK